MGLYNRRQYKALRAELHAAVRTQNRLMEWMNDQRQKEFSSQELLFAILQAVEDFSLVTPSQVQVLFGNMESQIEFEFRRIRDAIQQAQHRRLSASVLEGPRVAGLFDRLKDRAQALRAELLIDHPSDLLQLEASYVYDGEDVTILLHVPVVTPRSLLRLMRFHPFPFSFSNTHFLLPHPEKKLLAVSSESWTKELSESDLEGCYRVNSLHVCERLGIMKTEMATSCLGALYAQRFQDALARCPMNVVPLSEQVIQLSDNWFVIFAVEPLTAPIRCRNDSTNDVHLHAGINRLHLSPSCYAVLQEHAIFADSALSDNSIKSFEWKPQDPKLEEQKQETEDILAQIEAEGSNTPSLSAIRRQKAQNRRSPRWLYVILIASALGIACLILAFLWFLLHKRWQIMKAGMKVLIQHFVPGGSAGLAALSKVKATARQARGLARRLIPRRIAHRPRRHLRAAPSAGETTEDTVTVRRDRDAVTVRLDRDVAPAPTPRPRSHHFAICDESASEYPVQRVHTRPRAARSRNAAVPSSAIAMRRYRDTSP